MNTDMDDLIRDAVRRQEELAVDPDRIRAALPGRAANRRRTRGIAIAVTAAAVAVVVTVPIIAVPNQENGAAVFVAPEETTIPMRYRPTWLPDGMVEDSRTVPLTPNNMLGTVWGWKGTGGETTSWKINLLATSGGWSDDHPGAKVDINGASGYYNAGRYRATVAWPVDENTTLSLSASPPEISEEVLLQIARSVRPDPTRLRPPIHLGWLPGGDVEPTLEVAREAWPTKWSATIEARDYKAERYLSVSIGGPEPVEPLKETATVNGGTAYLDKGVLTMDLGDGRTLVVRSWGDNRLSRNELIRVAENVQLDPNPDIAWLGR